MEPRKDTLRFLRSFTARYKHFNLHTSWQLLRPTNSTLFYRSPLFTLRFLPKLSRNTHTSQVPPYWAYANLNMLRFFTEALEKHAHEPGSAVLGPR